MFEKEQIEQILARLSEYRQAILRRKWIILLCSVGLGTLLAFWAYRSPVKYTSTTLFHPESSAQNPGMMANPLSLILSGGMENSDESMMIGVLKSRNISEGVAGDTVKVGEDSTKVLIADLLIDAFPVSYNPVNIVKRLISGQPELSREKKIIIAGKMIRDNMALEVNEEGFIEMKFTFIDDDIVWIISNQCIKKLKKYYKDQKTAKARGNAEFFTQRADSVKTEIDKNTRAMAGHIDRSKYGVRAASTMRLAELETRQTLLTEMYVELVVAAEQAKAQQQKDTPVIQVLDEPLPPYGKDEKSVPLFAFLGIILGIILLSILITRKLWLADIKHLVQTQLLKQESE